MDGNHPKNIDPRPKRRRDKDNPYEIFTMGIETECPRYYIRFKDSSHIVHCFEISKELFNLLDSFELDDLSFLNEWDRYLEQSMQTEASMEARSICYQETVEETVFRHIESKMLHKATSLTTPHVPNSPQKAVFLKRIRMLSPMSRQNNSFPQSRDCLPMFLSCSVCTQVCVVKKYSV